VTYILWNSDMGHRIGRFDRLTDLAETVSEIVRADGADSVEELFVEVWAKGANEPVAVYGPAELGRIGHRASSTSFRTAKGVASAILERTRSTGRADVREVQLA
jgi:hypothetical protein